MMKIANNIFKSLAVMLILVSCANAAEVTGLDVVPTENSIMLAWDNTDTSYSVYMENTTLYKVASAPVFPAGSLSNLTSQVYVIRSPHPVYTNQVDYVYGVFDSSKVEFQAITADNDAATDDTFVYTVDYNDDNALSAGDLRYVFSEGGTIVRYLYSGTKWNVHPGSTAVSYVTGAGTASVTYKVSIPYTELTNVLDSGDKTHAYFKRTHVNGAEVSRYFPSLQSGITEANALTWAEFSTLGVGARDSMHIATVATNHYTIENLNAYSWYRGDVETLTDEAVFETMTQDSELLHVSGFVYDSDTGEPVFNADVYATYKGVSFIDVKTDITGAFNVTGLHALTYTVIAGKGETYTTDSKTFNLATGNVSGAEYYITHVPLPHAVETTTQTDIGIVWVMVCIAIVFFVIGLLTWGLNGVDMVSVGTMSIPIVICFKISNLFVDGTLTTTEKFLSSSDIVVVSTEVIRNSALSNLFMLIGIIIAMLVCLQLYQRIFGGEEVEEL